MSAGARSAAAGSIANSGEMDLERIVAARRDELEKRRADPALRARLGEVDRALAALPPPHDARPDLHRQRLTLQRRRDALVAALQRLESGQELKQFESRADRFLHQYRWAVANSPSAPAAAAAAAADAGAAGGAATPKAPAKGRKRAPAPKSDRPAKSRKRDAAAAPSDLVPEQARAVVREYLTEIEGVPPPVHVAQYDVCDRCQESLRLTSNGALLVCPRCHHGTPYMDMTSASISYGDEVEFSSFAYKKVHHFDDRLKGLQVKGRKKIEPWVLDAVVRFLHENGARQVRDIRKQDVRRALKSLRLRKYYDHDMQVYCCVTGLPAPTMSPEQEEMCRLMFMAIQEPFRKWCAIVDPTRSNFLSYSYVLFKICELLAYREFLPHFTLLKGKEKLRKQDVIWWGICRDLDWEFVPSLYRAADGVWYTRSSLLERWPRMAEHDDEWRRLFPPRPVASDWWQPPVHACAVAVDVLDRCFSAAASEADFPRPGTLDAWLAGAAPKTA